MAIISHLFTSAEACEAEAIKLLRRGYPAGSVIYCSAQELSPNSVPPRGNSFYLTDTYEQYTYCGLTILPTGYIQYVELPDED